MVSAFQAENFRSSSVNYAYRIYLRNNVRCFLCIAPDRIGDSARDCAKGFQFSPSDLLATDRPIATDGEFTKRRREGSVPQF